MAQQGLLILGRVVRPYGVRGEVEVSCFADSWAPFRDMGRVWVGPPEGPFQPVKLEHAQERNRAVVMKLAGVETHEAAAGLIGYEVTVLRVEAPSLPNGVFYHYDILGLEVHGGDQSLGIVRGILETPAHDVYVIRGPAGEWMLPATRAHIRRIDLAAGRIEIEPGMDLVAVTSEGEGSAETV
jgi:16S rRNA processing protein RimM